MGVFMILQPGPSCRRMMTIALLLALSLLAAPGMAATPVIRVVAPSNGTTLRGGSTATIAWTATTPLPEEAEEWEAFLSVDNGLYYASRITPHLDIDVRTFEWQVPNVASASVRLLIRVGNERDESLFELPLLLSIEPSPAIPTFSMSVEGTTGEAARPGDASVATWSDGDRSGHATLARHASLPPRVGGVCSAQTTFAAMVLPISDLTPPSRTKRILLFAEPARPRPLNPMRYLPSDFLSLLRRRNI